MTNQNQDETSADVTQLQQFAKMCQKAAEMCLKASRDETYPTLFRWKMYYTADTWDLMAKILRDTASSVTLKEPPKNVGLSVRMYEMMIEFSEQNE